MSDLVYRKYHISIVIGRNYYYKETKEIKLPRLILPYLIGYLISLPTVLLGFGGFRVFRNQNQGVKNSIKALSINFSGGLDKTHENNYDTQTINVFKNLYRETRESVSIDNVNLVLEVADFYVENKKVNRKYELIDFILLSLEKLDVKYIKTEHLKEIIETRDSTQMNEEFNFA